MPRAPPRNKRFDPFNGYELEAGGSGASDTVKREGEGRELKREENVSRRPSDVQTYRIPENHLYVFIQNPWPFDVSVSTARVSATYVNVVVTWICCMVRDLCDTEIGKSNVRIFYQCTHRDIIAEIELATLTSVAPLLGAHHSFKFLTPKHVGDTNHPSVIYQYNYEHFNSPERTNRTTQLASYTYLPPDFAIKNESVGFAYPTPSPSDAKRPQSAKPLPGRLIMGTPIARQIFLCRYRPRHKRPLLSPRNPDRRTSARTPPQEPTVPEPQARVKSEVKNEEDEKYRPSAQLLELYAKRQSEMHARNAESAGATEHVKKEVKAEHGDGDVRVKTEVKREACEPSNLLAEDLDVKPSRIDPRVKSEGVKSEGAVKQEQDRFKTEDALKNRLRANEHDDPPLGSGWGHLVEETPYKEHVKTMRRLQAVYMPVAVIELEEDKERRDEELPPAKAEEVKLYLPSELGAGVRNAGCRKGLPEMEAKLRRDVYAGADINCAGGRVGRRGSSVVPARKALIALRGLEACERYRELTHADPQLDEENGPARKKLGNIGSRLRRQHPAHLHDCVRVEWSKAKARKNRWEEEVQLIREEMKRVLRFLRWRAAWWERRRSTAGSDAYAYAARQAAAVRKMARSFKREWNKSAATAVRKAIQEESWLAESMAAFSVGAGDLHDAEEGEEAAADM
ncbi:hypothetical protein C8R47DRAFT_1084955 [Mycena vitilis]|nr:hypothetical protein C8R47DRAFT_1084955 [Mycena vitilis]